MRRSSGRAQVEPLAALAALLAVSAAFAIYVGALDDAIPAEPDSETPQAVHDGIQRNVSTAGVAKPGRLDAALGTVPEGWNANVTLVADGQQWDRGPVPPGDAERVTSRVSVALGPDRVQPGQLRVVVWR